MNKHRFRLIFSKTLGFLIPVAENSNAHCKPGQTCGPSNASRAPAPFAGSLKALPLAMLSCFAQPGFAEILAESGQPLGVTQSSSGVPVIEIADPNSKGLSHNRFQEFNVAKPGLIFNNSQRDGTSQIGGFVVHNPNLSKEARAILTEVSGPHASSLAGILEVFGGKADILIAKGWLINGKQPATLQEKLMTLTAMPGVVDKPLNIRQVDQMVENLNTSAKTTRVDIQPSQRVGYSYLNLVVEEKKEPSLTLRANNSGMGDAKDGRYRLTASTSISDLLLGNDTLGLNLNSRYYQLDDSNSEYSGGITYSVPFGYSKVDLRLNHSQYEKLSTGNYGNYDTSGNSQVYAAKLSRVLLREKIQKLTTSVELEHKNNANFVEDSRLITSSIPYTKISFGLEHVTQLLGGSLYSDMTLSKGLSILDSDQAAYDKHGQKKHFKKIEFNTAWSRPFSLAANDFNFSSRIGGQYSADNLLTSEKMGLGDEFTVRGFKGPPLWGDQAVYLSNTVTMPLKVSGATVSPLLGLDTGYAQDVAPRKDHGALTGLALGSSASWRYGGGAITLGIPLRMSDALKDTSQGTVIYLSTYLTL